MRTKNELYQEAMRTVAARRQVARARAEDARAEAEAKAAADALRARWPQVYTAQPVRGGAEVQILRKR